MNFKDTCRTIHTLLEKIQHDLGKAENGNKAASQRVRTNTIKFEKIAKLYRKESIKAEKAGVMDKRKSAVRKAKGGPKRKTAKAKAHPKKAPSRALARKRATAKIPQRRKR